MTYEEFKKEVVEQIKDFLPAEYQNAEVKIQDVIKNNDTHVSGLTIRNEEEIISPTLYLENFFEQLEEGNNSLSGILSSIADTYDQAMNNNISQNAQEIVGNITDYEATKNKIVPRMVNLESNEERLKGMPHTEMGDLAVTYHVNLGKEGDGTMSVAITNQMLERYGVSVGELHDQACANMENISPTTIKNMRDTLMEIMVPGYAEMNDEEKNQTAFEMGFDGTEQDAMYVISNTEKTFGAAALLDSESLDKFEEKIGQFYMLPSSVHECSLVPKNEGVEREALESMVQEVNATQVAPNEVLSDHVYAYDSETKEIYRADKEAEHQKEKEASRCEKRNEDKTRPSLKEKLEDKKKESRELAKDNKEKEKIQNKQRGGDAK